MAAIKFLGASVTSFDGSIGWGGQQSTLTVRLVPDISDGDSFFAETGSPALFFVQDGTRQFSFYGIIQAYSAVSNDSVNPEYEVTLVDPRNFLSGTQMILKNYTGYSNQTPNVLNVCGYLNYLYGFGGARTNEGGVPWKLVLEAITNLTDDNNDEGYGRSLQFNDYEYSVDLEALPELPDYFRVGAGATSISIMDFVEEVCSAAQYDFFFTMLRENGKNIITLRTVSRRENPVPGKITQFVNGVGGASSKYIGYEYRNDVNNKFLIGGNVEYLYLVTQNSGIPLQNDGDLVDVGLYDDLVMPFNGLDANGNAIIGSGNPFADEYNFTVDASKLKVAGIGQNYRMSNEELRCAISSKGDWEDYLLKENSITGSPHFGVSDKINLGNKSNTKFHQIFNTNNVIDWENFPIHTLYPSLGTNIKYLGRDAGSFHEENIKSLYNFVANHANQYFGKQYMVRMPFAESYRDEETNLIYNSREPTDGGFISDANLAIAVSSGILPQDYYKMSLPDGRIGCYCVYEYADKFYYDDLRPDEDVIDRNRIYLKSEVLPDVVYVDRATLYSPRIVVGVPNFIQPQYEKNLENADPRAPFNQANAKSSYNQTYKLVKEHAIANYDALAESGFFPENAYDSESGWRKFEEYLNKETDKILAWPDSYYALKAMAGKTPPPDLFVIPLRHNLRTYGPWYANGAEGATDFEQDVSLVPWNYGSYDNMNQVAVSRVTQNYSNQTFSEAGSVEFPGLPLNNLGSTLIDGGPYVTDITVSISQDKIITRYDMSTWTNRPGRLEQTVSERIDKLSRKNLELQRDIEEAKKRADVANARVSIVNLKRPRKDENKNA